MDGPRRYRTRAPANPARTKIVLEVFWGGLLPVPFVSAFLQNDFWFIAERRQEVFFTRGVTEQCVV